jgi:hypothetical protein
MGTQKRPNCFVLYRRDKALEIRKQHPHHSFPNRVLSQMSGVMWKKESEEIRKYYQDLARRELEISVGGPSVPDVVDKEPQEEIKVEIVDTELQFEFDEQHVNDGTVWETLPRTPSPIAESEIKTWFTF